MSFCLWKTGGLTLQTHILQSFTLYSTTAFMFHIFSFLRNYRMSYRQLLYLCFHTQVPPDLALISFTLSSPLLSVFAYFYTITAVSKPLVFFFLISQSYVIDPCSVFLDAPCLALALALSVSFLILILQYLFCLLFFWLFCIGVSFSFENNIVSRKKLSHAAYLQHLLDDEN